MTKQGTNQPRGVGFSYLTESGMVSKDFFTTQRNLPKPDTLKRSTAA